MKRSKNQIKNYPGAFVGTKFLADKANRFRKAEKILAVLRDVGILQRCKLKALDLGCSHGFILKKLSSEVDYCVGIDIDQYMVPQIARNIVYLRADGERLPLVSGCFDIVICNHVYEHTDNPEQLLAEIERILAPTGVCYFAGPNKYDLIEPHYRLPFLSWLPHSIADKYVRLAGKGQCYPVRPYSYPSLKKLLKRFDVSDYTGKVLANPVQYCATDMLPLKSIKKLVAITLFKVFPLIFPGFIFVLTKRTKEP